MNKTELVNAIAKNEGIEKKCAEKAVAKMRNEDGSTGAHWSIEEAAQIAQQFGVNIKGDKFNKYDWFVALNMVRSDFYKAIVNMTGSDNVKHFVELTKAWLNDKDIETGKMWMYFKYVMCDAYHEEEVGEEDKKDTFVYEGGIKEFVQYVIENNFEVVCGVGGGVMGDIVKLIAEIANIALVQIPTSSATCVRLSNSSKE